VIFLPGVAIVFARPGRHKTRYATDGMLQKTVTVDSMSGSADHSGINCICTL